MKSLVVFTSVMLLALNLQAEEDKEKVTANDADVVLESLLTGDKEQPAISYFIPWQGTSTPDKLQWDMQQKHDATLQLIDRDVMVRSINIYEDMNMENTD